MNPQAIIEPHMELFLTRKRSGIAIVTGVITPEQLKDNSVYGADVVLSMVIFCNRNAGVGKRIAQFTLN